MKFLSFAMLAAVSAVATAAEPSYSVVDRYPGPDGGYDYISFDGANQRLFVGRTTGVMTIDLPSRKVTGDFIKGQDVAAVLVIPDSSLMLATVGGANAATVFDRVRGVVKANISTGKSPDGALYDPASKLVFVMNGESADVTLIDIARARAVATIPIGGTPEAAASDGNGRVYINVEDTAEIAVVDSKARKVVARHKLPGCVEPTGMAFDATTGLLMSVCHNETAKLIDARTGQDAGSVRIGKGADGAIFDARRRLVYVPCNDGTLWIFRLTTAGKAVPVQSLKTHPYARTAALDPETGRIYLPAIQRRADASGEMKRVPGTFQVLVVAAAGAE
jgi:YVTN family beta-propeller protein